MSIQSIQQAIQQDDEDQFNLALTNNPPLKVVHAAFRAAYDRPTTRYIWHLVNNNNIDAEPYKGAIAYKAAIHDDQPLFQYIKSNYKLTTSCLETCNIINNLHRYDDISMPL
ncbi:MAG: hypothetical protein K0U52_02140 [Gammaproteobacteria bacterium]|nr:hypothetical protein [Gammaproteobacteria bacterium]